MSVMYLVRGNGCESSKRWCSVLSNNSKGPSGLPSAGQWSYKNVSIAALLLKMTQIKSEIWTRRDGKVFPPTEPHDSPSRQLLSDICTQAVINTLLVG